MESVTSSQRGQRTKQQMDDLLTNRWTRGGKLHLQ